MCVGVCIHRCFLIWRVTGSPTGIFHHSFMLQGICLQTNVYLNAYFHTLGFRNDPNTHIHGQTHTHLYKCLNLFVDFRNFCPVFSCHAWEKPCLGWTQTHTVILLLSPFEEVVLCFFILFQRVTDSFTNVLLADFILWDDVLCFEGLWRTEVLRFIASD